MLARIVSSGRFTAQQPSHHRTKYNNTNPRHLHSSLAQSMYNRGQASSGLMKSYNTYLLTYPTE